MVGIRMMFTIGCPFCTKAIIREFWDEVEEHVMGCYDKATPQQQGRPWAVDDPIPYSSPEEDKAIAASDVVMR